MDGGVTVGGKVGGGKVVAVGRGVAVGGLTGVVVATAIIVATGIGTEVGTGVSDGMGTGVDVAIRIGGMAVEVTTPGRSTSWKQPANINSITDRAGQDIEIIAALWNLTIGLEWPVDSH